MDRPPFSLDQLAAQGKCSPRTIRSWMQAGLLPKAAAPGPGKHYGADHMTRVQFIRACQEAAGEQGARLSLEQLRTLLESRPREEIQRIADGREGVSAQVVGSIPSVSREAPIACREVGPDLRMPQQLAAHQSTSRTTTFHVLDDLDLHLKTDDPERVAWAARLARKIAEWAEEEE